MPLSNHSSAVAGLRDAVIAHYRDRRTVASRRGDKEQAQFLDARLRDLVRRRLIQLTHNEIPRDYRPELFASLYELRGDVLVVVPTWRPHAERPTEWAI